MADEDEYQAPAEDTDSLDELKEESAGGLLDTDPDDVDVYELPSTELNPEDLVVKVLPKQADEFTCSSCFLVMHRSRRVPGTEICRDCE